jgi:hypothetical protein
MLTSPTALRVVLRRSTALRLSLRAPRSALAGALLSALVLAACGDPADPVRCDVAIEPVGPVLLAGTRAQATARSSCTRGVPATLRWSVSDTTIATVDSTGVVTAVAGGQVLLFAELTAPAAARDSTPVLVEPPYEIVLSPTRFDLLPLSRQALNVSLLPNLLTPPGFPRTVDVQSSDPCVARLDAQNFIVTGKPGRVFVRMRLVAAPGIRDSVTVQVGVPAASRTFVAAITDATGATADPHVLGGRVSVTVNFLYPLTGGQLVLRLGGRTAATQLLAAPLDPALVGPQRLTVALDTDARDAGGARRFPNGVQELEAALVVPDVPGLPGCPAVNLSDRAVQQVTLANP